MVRILLVRIILHGIEISAFCAYAPTEKYADSTKEKFFSTLSSAISKVKKEHPGFKILVGADMNATIGDDSFGLGLILASITTSLRLMTMVTACFICPRRTTFLL